jgi:hypothetical protein
VCCAKRLMAHFYGRERKERARCTGSASTSPLSLWEVPGPPRSVWAMLLKGNSSEYELESMSCVSGMKNDRRITTCIASPMLMFI